MAEKTKKHHNLANGNGHHHGNGYHSSNGVLNAVPLQLGKNCKSSWSSCRSGFATKVSA